MFLSGAWLAISEVYIARDNPGKSWLTFLNNHREMIVALDFFTVLTLRFQLLYCLFVIEHGRRKILHFNITRHPTADWVLQQLRETFSGTEAYRYVILDHDSKFDADVIVFLKSTGLKPKHQRAGAMAEWTGRKVGGKLPPRTSRPYHRA